MRGRAIIGIVGVLFGLAGCSKEKELGEYDVSQIKGLQVTDSIRAMTDTTTGQEMRSERPEGYIKPTVNVVGGGGGYRNSEWQSAGIEMPTHRSAGFRGPDADYIDKCDVYWKLNWIRKRLQSGKLPSNLKEAVAQTRKLLMTAARDRNFNTGEEAVIALEEGIEHLEAQRTLRLGNVEALLVPWGAGRAAVERHFDKDKARTNPTELKPNKYLTHSSGSLSLDLTQSSSAMPRPAHMGRTTVIAPSVKAAQSLALSYADKYTASPEDMMRRSWQKAIEKINKLRDDLGLMNRTDNSDRNDVSVPTILGATVETQDKTEETDSAMDNVVPVPSIYGNARRVDVPDSTFKEPDNPFSKP